MFDTIHHIAIIGSDYEKSKHFYVDLLGFEIIRENYRKERDDYKIDLACGKQEIELFIIKDAPVRVNYPEALGLRHLAFKVDYDVYAFSNAVAYLKRNSYIEPTGVKGSYRVIKKKSKQIIYKTVIRIFFMFHHFCQQEFQIPKWI